MLKEQQETRSALVNDFLGSVQNEIYGLVNEALSDTLASIKKNDSLTSRSVVQLKNVVEKLSNLNFWGDRRLDTIKDEIQSLLDRPQKQRSAAIATTVLEELSYQARVANLDLQSLRDDPIIPPSLTQSFDNLLPVKRLDTSAQRPAQEGYDKLAQINGWAGQEIKVSDPSVDDVFQNTSNSDLVWDGSVGKYVTEEESLNNSKNFLEGIGFNFEPVAKTQAELDQYIKEETTPPTRPAQRRSVSKLF